MISSKKAAGYLVKMIMAVVLIAIGFALYRTLIINPSKGVEECMGDCVSRDACNFPDRIYSKKCVDNGKEIQNTVCCIGQNFLKDKDVEEDNEEKDPSTEDSDTKPEVPGPSSESTVMVPAEINLKQGDALNEPYKFLLVGQEYDFRILSKGSEVKTCKIMTVNRAGNTIEGNLKYEHESNGNCDNVKIPFKVELTDYERLYDEHTRDAQVIIKVLLSNETNTLKTNDYLLQIYKP